MIQCHACPGLAMSLGYYVMTSRASDRANSLSSPHATHTLDLALPNMILCRKVTECLCRDSNHLCPGTPMLLDSSPVPIVCPQLETNGGATACLYTCLHTALVGTSGVALVGTSGLSWHGTKPRAACLCRFGAARSQLLNKKSEALREGLWRDNR